MFGTVSISERLSVSTKPRIRGNHVAALDVISLCVGLPQKRLLVTTRIKNILSQGSEIELELLSITESVELLAGVAEIDASQIPPACLEIASLCGRLPLCLSIGATLRLYLSSLPLTHTLPLRCL